MIPKMIPKQILKLSANRPHSLQFVAMITLVKR
jgi:hypothetical protein